MCITNLTTIKNVCSCMVGLGVGFKGLQGGSVVSEAKWNIVIMGCVELYCPVSHVLWFLWCAVTGDIVLMYNSGAEI